LLWIDRLKISSVANKILER